MGFIPPWAKDMNSGPLLINARAETAAEKPAFRSAFKKSRCLIPADRFFEWKKIAGKKQPYHIRRADGRTGCEDVKSATFPRQLDGASSVLRVGRLLQ